MIRISYLLPAAVMFLPFWRTANAQVRTGGPIAAVLESTDSGGTSASGAYVQTLVLAPVAGLADAPAGQVVNRTGYAAQLTEVQSVVLTATPATVDELASRPVAARARLVDDTHIDLRPSDTAWSVLSGPIHAPTFTNGVALALAVYQDTGAQVSASFRGVQGVASLTILDVLPDNYALYAGDQLPDAWQVLHFGVDNLLAAPGQDPDADGQNNLFEYVAGVSPTNQLSRFVFDIARVPAQPAQASLTLTPHFPDRTYVVEGRTNLLAGGWTPVAGITNNVGPVKTVLDPAISGPLKYYQVRIHKP